MNWSFRDILANNDHYAFSEYELATEYGLSSTEIEKGVSEYRNNIEIIYRHGLPLYRWRR